MMQPAVTFGPPVGEGWRSETRWWRAFLCACNYEGREYWNASGENTLVCTKCGWGRRADTPLPPAPSEPPAPVEPARASEPLGRNLVVVRSKGGVPFEVLPIITSNAAMAEEMAVQRNQAATDGWTYTVCELRRPTSGDAAGEMREIKALAAQYEADPVNIYDKPSSWRKLHALLTAIREAAPPHRTEGETT